MFVCGTVRGAECERANIAVAVDLTLNANACTVFSISLMEHIYIVYICSYNARVVFCAVDDVGAFLFTCYLYFSSAQQHKNIQNECVTGKLCLHYTI